MNIPNFNTSYVIFYLGSISFRFALLVFQYILCYFLSFPFICQYYFIIISIHPMLFFICSRCYRIDSDSAFQYILCYFLSGNTALREGRRTNISIHPMLFFIKAIRALHNVRKFHFNTSYVIFYRRTGTGFSVAWNYFNTSYVIFYRKRRPTAGGYSGISIHPMLFFI